MKMSTGQDVRKDFQTLEKVDSGIFIIHSFAGHPIFAAVAAVAVLHSTSSSSTQRSAWHVSGVFLLLKMSKKYLIVVWYLKIVLWQIALAKGPFSFAIGPQLLTQILRTQRTLTFLAGLQHAPFVC